MGFYRKIGLFLVSFYTSLYSPMLHLSPSQTLQCQRKRKLNPGLTATLTVELLRYPMCYISSAKTKSHPRLSKGQLKINERGPPFKQTRRCSDLSLPERLHANELLKQVLTCNFIQINGHTCKKSTSLENCSIQSK